MNRLLDAATLALITTLFLVSAYTLSLGWLWTFLGASLFYALVSYFIRKDKAERSSRGRR